MKMIKRLSEKEIQKKIVEQYGTIGEITREDLKELGLKYAYYSLRKSLAGFVNKTPEEFSKLDDTEFYRVYGLGKTRISELIWLRDFIKGEIDGKYEPEERKKSEQEKMHSMQIQHHFDIEKRLRDEIKHLKEENREIKSEIKILKKKEQKYEELREFFLYRE